MFKILFNAFCLMIALLSGVSLFVLKYHVKAEEELLQKTHREILQTKREIHMLEAEWAYLNDPQRLLALVQSQTDWRVIAPKQLVTLTDIPLRPDESDEEDVSVSDVIDEPAKKPQKEFVMRAERPIKTVTVKEPENFSGKAETQPAEKTSLSDLAQNAKALTAGGQIQSKPKNVSKLKGTSQKDFVWSPAKQKKKNRSTETGKRSYAR